VDVNIADARGCFGVVDVDPGLREVDVVHVELA
jgi:hypothetical protein